MEIHLIIQGKDDPPQLRGLKEPIIDLGQNEKMTLCLVEGGMESGEPSVLIISTDRDGSIVLQTSLDKFLTGASGMMAAAEARWGWKRPEGSFTLMPPDKKTQKMLLEAIKKELEEWEDGELET